MRAALLLCLLALALASEDPTESLQGVQDLSESSSGVTVPPGALIG